MRNPCISPSAAKKLLVKLQKEKSEASNIDAKETLNLKQDGDRATFIRHVAALSNTGKKSYLLIGVEDKTWTLKGIPDDSPLLNVDVVQQQMNQILANRLDPPISILYRVHNLDGKPMGVVEIEGKNPPYIVAIEDEKFGGGKTGGKSSYIYRGVIYHRRGTDSIPVTRQHDIIKILNLKRDLLEIVITLVFMGAITAVGVGVLCYASSAWMLDLGGVVVLSGVWGMFVGWIFNFRLANAVGYIATSWIEKIIKTFGGITWSGCVGFYVSIAFVGGILSGGIIISDFFSISLFIVPITAIAFILRFLFTIFVAYQIQKAYKRGTIF